MKFIFPRLIALTAIVGLATLVLGLLFKLLIGATVITSLVFAARKAFRRHGYNHHGMQGYDQPMSLGRGAMQQSQPWRQNPYAAQHSGIIPIN